MMAMNGDKGIVGLQASTLAAVSVLGFFDCGRWCMYSKNMRNKRKNYLSVDLRVRRGSRQSREIHLMFLIFLTMLVLFVL
ncbi:hypothetical protein M8C21_033289 [Ambrosia artemisiifolia]|uniref:Transmembrane protein n=1 Tax=Ambrosia artemisiifolia TaxID=4212 RepID=A0AAD5GC16_AMBAR|nr:hypothetical protein M8C21_033289 [Ambrosia artemisiifolia]